MPQSLLRVLDHPVYATPDLHATVQRLEIDIGVGATAGGRHPARGTMNILLFVSLIITAVLVAPPGSKARSRCS
jgi:Glyoxalase-like domain